MAQRVIVALTTVLFCAPSVQPAADPLGENAALQYWQAFAMMPSDDQLNERQRKALGDVATAPLDRAAEELTGKSRTALVYLHRGAALRPCSWGLAAGLKQDGPLEVRLPHVFKAVRLARVACLRARYAFEQGQPRAALDDLLAVLVLARHAAVDGTVISKGAEYAIENLAVEVAAAHAGTIKDPKILRTVLVGLKALPRSEALGEVIRRERDAYTAWIRAKRLAALEVVIPDFDGADDRKKKQIREFLGINESVYDKICEALTKRYDEAAAIAELPFDRYEAAAGPFLKKLKGFDPAAKPLVVDIVPRLLAPPLKVRRAEARTQARLAMFQAAVAILADGKDQLKAFRDTFGSGPFGYREFEDGFELKSKLHDAEGKHVSLLFRTAGKQ